MAYVDELFPEDISRGSTGGFTWDIKTTKTDSDAIFKQIRNEAPAAVFNASINTRSQEELDKIRDFFMVVGTGNTFRFKWQQDFTSAANHRDTPTRLDQNIGTGDGVNRVYPIFKTYTSGGLSVTRQIRRIAPGTLLVAVDNTLVTEYTEIEGTIIFDEGSTEIPGANATVTVGFEHHYEVSLDLTEGQPLIFELLAFTAGRVSSDLVLVEHKDPDPAPTILPERGHVDYGNDVDTDFAVLVTDGHYHTFTATADINVIVQNPNELPAGGHHFTFLNRGGNSATIVAVNDLVTPIKVITSIGDSWTKLAISRDPATGVQTWEAHSQQS